MLGWQIPYILLPCYLWTLCCSWKWPNKDPSVTNWIPQKAGLLGAKRGGWQPPSPALRSQQSTALLSALLSDIRSVVWNQPWGGACGLQKLGNAASGVPSPQKEPPVKHHACYCLQAGVASVLHSPGLCAAPGYGLTEGSSASPAVCSLPLSWRRDNGHPLPASRDALCWVLWKSVLKRALQIGSSIVLIMLRNKKEVRRGKQFYDGRDGDPGLLGSLGLRYQSDAPGGSIFSAKHSESKWGR